MIKSFILSLSCMNNKVIRSIMIKSVILTLAIIFVLGYAMFYVSDYALSLLGWGMDLGAWSYIANFVVTAILWWFLFRIIAVLILWMFADDIVEAIEWQHYSHAALNATKPSWIRSLAIGLRSVLRAIIYNLLALPLYIFALFTIVGMPIIFLIINGYLLGRELEEMVALRHNGVLLNVPGQWEMGKFERFILGLVMNAAMLIPFVNFLIPVIATATATHIMHRKMDR